MLEKHIQAQEAADFLTGEVWKRAYARARANIFSQWEAAQTPAERETAHSLLKALDLVKTAIVSEASSVAVEQMKAQAKG